MKPLLLQAFGTLARGLAQRARGAPVPGLPDWADPGAVVSLQLALDKAAPRIEIALRDGVPARALPSHWRLGPERILLALRRAPRAQAQGAPQLRRSAEPRLVGTATALVRDELAPDRNYLLTCGHVVAPNLATRVDDMVEIESPQPMSGRLAEWLPPLGGEAYRTNLDAALVEVLRSDAVALQADAAALAAGIGGAARRDQAVTLRRRSTPLAGALKIHWSGWVDLPGLTPGVADYFLDGAVGYAAAAPTIGGDSGAALWDDADRLVGMHLGAIPDAAPGAANAVMAPIAPVLDWFSVRPYLRGDPATLPAGEPRRGRVAPAPDADGAVDDVVSVVARTLWGEARGEGPTGMEAVANVVRNRLDRGWRGARSAAEVCLARRQFSCWNDGDPNLARMERVMRAPDDAYRMACDIARRMLAGQLADRTGGATHYVASSLRERPDWLLGLRPCAVIGRHEFYKDIA